MKWFLNYVTCASFYGSARAAFRVHDMDLPGTRILTIVLGGIYGPCLLPVYVLNDINRGYMTKYGIDYAKYGYPDKCTNISDVLFK